MPGRPPSVLDVACDDGATKPAATEKWVFMFAEWRNPDGDIVKVDPAGPLTVRIGGAFDLTVQAAIDGLGVVHLFEDWLRPHLDSGALEPILEPWWQRFTGTYLYYPGRRYLPSPLRAFIDFINTP